MPNPPRKIWDREHQRHNRKLERAASALGDKVVSADLAVRLLEAVIEPDDRVCLEGNNQKQVR